MAPNGKPKSRGLFSRPSLSSLRTQHVQTDNTKTNSPTGTDYAEKEVKKKRRASFFGLPASSSSDFLAPPTSSPTQEAPLSSSAPNSPRLPNSPGMRPRGLQKARPTSMFGLAKGGKKVVVDVEDDEVAPQSPSDVKVKQKILHHGEISTSTGFSIRKKTTYLVLTTTHLIRFKSLSKARESFPEISPHSGRANTTRHASSASVNSLHETHSFTSIEGEKNRIPLGQIVSAFRVGDGRPFFTLEVVWLDEDLTGPGSFQLILADQTEAGLWQDSIRAAAEKARLMMPLPYPERVIKYLVDVVSDARDYDPEHFSVYRVVRDPVDKYLKNESYVFYMVIGVNTLYMIPTPDYSAEQLTMRALRHKEYGLVSLTELRFLRTEDRFSMTFRRPARAASVHTLAASGTSDIAAALMDAIRWLKPMWEELHINITDVPHGADSKMNTCHSMNMGRPSRFTQVGQQEDFGFFDRTLIAYCIAYKCDPGNIQYAIDWDVELAPELRIYPPRMTEMYAFAELVAIFRSLGYNDCFGSISFKDINLGSLQKSDPHFPSNYNWATGYYLWDRFSLNKSQYRPKERSVLFREVQALAWHSSGQPDRYLEPGQQRTGLRRLDFTNCLAGKRAQYKIDEDGDEKDPGCDIVAALFTVISLGQSTVESISLSGIELGETDMEDLLTALKVREGAYPITRLRALNFSRCGLSDESLMSKFFAAISWRGELMQELDISDNSGRIRIENFHKDMRCFPNLRKLGLSRISRITTTEHVEPIFPKDLMLTWKLEELTLNGVLLNNNSFEVLTSYLNSPSSRNLRVLQLDQCNLKGGQVANLMKSAAHISGLALHVSANRLEDGMGDFIAAVQNNCTPSTLVVQMIEFTKDGHFRQLLDALRTNTTIEDLDISKASLPSDADEATCNALKKVFSKNTTLRSLDISGEQAHLEVTRFGLGLSKSLDGLKQNTTLRCLRIEHQDLGLEGANALADVIDSNRTLTHVYCEHNDINLQGFTTLVNAVANNTSILDLPLMHGDQDCTLKRMCTSMREARRDTMANKTETKVKTSVRRAIKGIGINTKKLPLPEVTPQDIDETMRLLAEKWTSQIDRLVQILQRNRNIAAGVIDPEAESPVKEELLRPATAMSDNGVLQMVLSNTTPRWEPDNPMKDYTSQLAGLGMNDDGPWRASGAENLKGKVKVYVRHEDSTDDEVGRGSSSGSGKARSRRGGGMLPAITLNEESSVRH